VIVVLIAAAVVAVWLGVLVAVTLALERELAELREVRRISEAELLWSRATSTASESRATPDIGTPPLIPPPFDADSRPD
jgi:hypothetical protein